MRLSSNVRFVLAALALAGVSAPRVAEACGGTFCDNGPMPMPVDQTGENIAFVMRPGMVEAHIQIQYKGEAPKFSWILPVQALPEFAVGSQGLFDKLLQGTVPTYNVTTRPDFCGDPGGSNGFSASTSATGTGTGGAGGAGPGVPPIVVFQKPVGAFDVTVLSSPSTQAVIQWLMDNQYQVPTNAKSLLDGYVANGFYFVAVKLTGGKGIDQIHPLVVRYPGNNPCVPIKLTSVAAVNDMGIRTFFLGSKRVVPKNYKHVQPNFVNFDWFNATTTYANLVSRAIDEMVANGKAWVTEYAGSTSAAVGGTAPLAQPGWNAAPFEGVAAVGVVQLLQNQNFMSCIGNQCTYNHVLVLPLLRQYLPPPASIVVQGRTITDPTEIEGYFYTCLACYPNSDMTKWNAMSFASDLSKNIIEPSKNADMLLTTFPYLTRMFTTLSPVEMDLDPEFLERDGLDSVARIQLTAIQRITCDQRAGMILPDGRDVALASQGTWPVFSNRMPWAEKIDEIQPDKVIHLMDNTAKIDAELANWNSAQSWPPPSTGPTTGGNVTVGAGGAGGANGGAVVIDNGSCGCRGVGARTTATPWAAAALLGLLARFAKKRARS
jgi:hypothetical protein